MRLHKILTGTSVAILLTIGFASESQHFNTFAQGAQTAGTAGVAVGPQYDTTHVYVAPQDFDRIVASLNSRRREKKRKRDACFRYRSRCLEVTAQTRVVCTGQNRFPFVFQSTC